MMNLATTNALYHANTLLLSNLPTFQCRNHLRLLLPHYYHHHPTTVTPTTTTTTHYYCHYYPLLLSLPTTTPFRTPTKNAAYLPGECQRLHNLDADLYTRALLLIVLLFHHLSQKKKGQVGRNGIIQGLK
jgi:hypothetical protein